MNDDFVYTLPDTITLSDEDNITINLDSISSNTGTYSITSDLSISGSTPNITIDNTNYSYSNILDNMIDPDEVENMCEEYPALSKVWRNFKSVYDMTLQDYKGKKEEGDINDPIPF